MDDDDGLDRFKHPDIIHTSPTLKDLHRYITPWYAAKWKVLGTLLGIPNGILDAIGYGHQFRSKPCCNAMLEKWLHVCGDVSWEKLFVVLESPHISNKDMSEQLRTTTMDDGGLEQFKHPDKANSRPSIDDLKQHFTPRYSADWKTIGILLGLRTVELEIIEQDYCRFPYFCFIACNEMLQRWLEIDATACWTKLFAVIKSPAMTSMLDQSRDKGMSGPLRFSDMDNGGLEQFKDPKKVNTVPLLKDLYQQITPRYAVEWKVIGTLLGIHSGQLDAIEVDHPHRVKDCCNQMLESWLQMDITASWGKMCTVIESPAVSHSKVTNKEMFKRLYYQAKHNLGTEELQLYKLVIFGPPGVGKSSLFQVLLGNNPNPKRNSTGVLHRKLVQAKVAITTLAGQSKSSWHLLSIENEILRLRSTIKSVIEKSKQVETTLPAAVNVASDSTIKVASESNRSEMKVEKKLFQPFTEAPAQIRYASTLMACYDSGGQPEFFDVMPALMTIPTGNIMVFDLSKDIHLNIQSEFYEEGKSSQLHQAHYTTAELMKTAIANIQSYSKNVSSDTSESNTNCLLVVGTHLDMCGQTVDEKLCKVTEIEATMCSDVLASGAIQMVYSDSDGRIIHPISNTDHEGRDEAAQKIRTAIEHMSKYQKSYSQVPINWLLFQLEVQLTGEDYIERSECIEIAKHCYIRENEVDYVLMYFHQLGILLHYREVSGLNDIIFCNPQWLFDQLTELIKVKYNAPPLIQQDISKGIFHKQRLFDIYSKKLDAKGKLKFENLLELFAHLKIMSVLPNKTDQYFMPALLNPAPTNIPLQEEYGVQVCDTMLVKFKNRYFPRGMFCCLITHLSQSGWFIQVKCAYKNLITFQLVPDHYVILFDKINHMAVRIHYKQGSKPQGNHYEVCNHFDVCNILYKSLKKLCKMFQMNYDFKFGFACKDCSKFAGVKLQYALPTNFICKECQKSYQLNHDQLVWFIPPYISEVQALTLQQPSHLTNEDVVGPSRKGQKTEASDKPNEVYHNKKPDMWNLIKIVIPKIQADWEDVAYSMQYDVATVEAFKEHCHDGKKCCRKLFEDWLNSSHGTTPKTWSKLLERIKEVDSLHAASKNIVKELKSKFNE